MDNKKRIRAVWHCIIRRCYDEKATYYNIYGGRGIKVCEEWRNNFHTFAKWAYENGYNENAPRGQCSIDRIDNNGNYEPSNCRWANAKEQSLNSSIPNFYEYQGDVKCVIDWSKDHRCAVTYEALRSRLRKRNWPFEKALITPDQNVKYYEYNGKNLTILQWLKEPECLASKEALNSRLHRGWNVGDAITTPTQKRKTNNVVNRRKPDQRL